MATGTAATSGSSARAGRRSSSRLPRRLENRHNGNPLGQQNRARARLVRERGCQTRWSRLLARGSRFIHAVLAGREVSKIRSVLKLNDLGTSLPGVTRPPELLRSPNKGRVTVIDSCVSNVLSSGWEDSDAAIRKPGGA